MTEIEQFEVARRRKLTPPPPPLKPKPKLLTISMCQDVNIDDYCNGGSSNSTPMTSSVYANEERDDCEDYFHRPSSSSTYTECIFENSENNDSSTSAIVLPRGTVKALAEKFGGSTKNLHKAFQVYKSQTLPRPPRPASRKVSFKHRPSVSHSRVLENAKFTYSPNVAVQNNKGGSSRSSSIKSYGSWSSLNSSSPWKQHRLPRKSSSTLRKSYSQDLMKKSHHTTDHVSVHKSSLSASILFRSKSVEPHLDNSPLSPETPGVETPFPDGNPVMQISFLHGRRSATKRSPPPIPEKPKLCDLRRGEHVISSDVIIDDDDHVYDEYDDFTIARSFCHADQSKFASPFTACRHSSTELPGSEEIQRVDLDNSFDTTIASCGSNTLKSCSSVNDGTDDVIENCDLINGTILQYDDDVGNGLESVESNVNVVNSCENYAEIIYELPRISSQTSSNGKHSGGKKSVSSWDTSSSLASSSETSAAPSLTGYRSLSQEIRSNYAPVVNEILHRQSMDLVESTATDFAAVVPQQPPGAVQPDDVINATGESRRSRLRLPRSLRPKSQTIDIEKFMRIKSDIRLNLSQAMGKIKLRVSTSRSNRDQKAKSTFYLPNNVSTSDPSSISITLETPISSESTNKDDDCSSSVSGDTWDFTPNDEEQGVARIRITSKDEDRSSSSGEQMDNGNNCAGGKHLPDLVQHELRRNSSLDEAALPCSPCSDTTRSLSNDTAPLSPYMAPSTSGDMTDSQIADVERFECVYSSRFAFSEPLYQHYRTAEMGANVGLATVQRNQTFSEADARGARREKLLNASQLGSQRTLWCELPEVQEAGLLSSLKDDERKLQEAMFEVITSEASYLRSLNILITHFMACPQLSSNCALGSVIDRHARKRLFSNILAVRDCSENLLCNLETRLESCVVLDDVCDVLVDHLNRNCEVYVKYCSNQIYQERVLNFLKTTNVEFRNVLTGLESSCVCESLDLRSFLMLPMQRITRYPLLAGAILHRVFNKSAKQYKTAEKAFSTASRVVKECNEGAKRFERIEQMIDLEKRFVYKEAGPKRLALISGNRWVIKQGPVVQIEFRRRSLGRPQTRKLFLFLFTDLLIVTKMNVENNDKSTYHVRDYCPRQFLVAESLEPVGPRIPAGAQLNQNSHVFLLTLMKNHRQKQSDYLLTVDTETEKTRWLDSVRPKPVGGASVDEDLTDDESNTEKVYEFWDCPQVKCTEAYRAKQEDELDLELDELINVLRKLPDGWFHGERLRDGKTGWFPSSCTVEVISDHIRAKNYRQRLKLMHEAELQISINNAQTNRRTSSGLSVAKSIFRL